MLKEVGASGQISLGKKYAGQLFDVVFAPDGRVELVPMKAVPVLKAELSKGAPSAPRVGEDTATYRVGDGWLTPERRTKAQQRPETTGQWAEKHAVQIDEYNAWAGQNEPYSQRVRHWRESVVPKSEAGKL